ncbi:MAG TPA: S41 family peptidase [Longimicrobium sp.]|nr:S41 family peptidase [Longimicrobium sp.]
MRHLAPAAALAGLLAAHSLAAQTPVTAALATETFDTAWTVIARTHWDSTYNGVDWNGLRAELRPRAEAARSNEALRAVLVDMLGRLHQSHFGIIPGDVQETLSGGEAPSGQGVAGLDARLVDGRFLVTRVLPGGAAEAVGVKTGWAIDAVAGHPTADILAALARLPADTDPRVRSLHGWSALTRYFRGDAGDSVAVRFLDAADRPVDATLVLRPATGVVTRFGNLPAMIVRVETERAPLPDGRTVGILRFNYWMPVVARQIDEAVDRLRDTDGLVIDLRGNLGGVGGMAAGVAGHFVERRDTLATMRMRGQSLYFVADPRRVDTRSQPVQPYSRPVAVLTDAETASTSEFFAGGLQKLGRARVFGETSAGQALPAIARRLPNGDVMMHAIADFTGPTGERFEGAGVVPDQPAPPTRAALLAGHDPALDAAKAWIASQPRN